MWKRIVFFGVVAFLGLALLGSLTRNHVDYSEKSRSEFMKGCLQTGADEAGCGCIWTQVKAQVPEEQFAADAAAVDKGEMTGAALRTKYESVVQPCIQT